MESEVFEPALGVEQHAGNGRVSRLSGLGGWKMERWEVLFVWSDEGLLEESGDG